MGGLPPERNDQGQLLDPETGEEVAETTQRYELEFVEVNSAVLEAIASEQPLHRLVPWQQFVREELKRLAPGDRLRGPVEIGVPRFRESGSDAGV